MDNTIRFLQSHSIRFEENVDLKRKTWIHRGGNASIYIIPSNKEELSSICLHLYKEKKDFLILGHTSNVYIRNTYNIDIVISTRKCKKINITDNQITCECGVNLPTLSKLMIRGGVSGFEYLTQVPGTIGGAICNNSSCKNNSISELIIQVEFLTQRGEIIFLNKDDFDFSFRNSALKDGRLKGVILSTSLKKIAGDPSALSEIAKANEIDRFERLEGKARNLGCIVNGVYSQGNRPIIVLALSLLAKIYRLCCRKTLIEQKIWFKKHILNITGYKHLKPYISDKNMIVYVWHDNNADLYFNDYLCFMQKYFGTDNIEIQVFG